MILPWLPGMDSLYLCYLYIDTYLLYLINLDLT